MTDHNHLFRNSAVLLAGTTAALYCISTAHTTGYLSTLRLDPDMLDRNFHQVLYHGLLISFSPILLALFIYSVAHFFYAFGVLPSIIQWLQKSVRNKRLFIKKKNAFFGRRKGVPVERIAKRKSILALIYTGLTFGFLLSLYYSEKRGVEEAIEVQSLFNHQAQLSQSQLITVTVNDMEKQLLYLFCGARNCAGIELDSKKVHYFPQTGHSFQYEEK